MQTWPADFPQHILFGFPTSLTIPIVYDALLGVLRQHMWLARNNHRFENQSPVVPLTLQQAKSTFRFLVRLQFRHGQRYRFVHDWLADGVIGSITDDKWIRFTSDFIT